MDRPMNADKTPDPTAPNGQAQQQPPRGMTRRRWFRYSLGGLAAAAGAGAYAWWIWQRVRAKSAEQADWLVEIFRDDAPSEELWGKWVKRGWIREAHHYRKTGRSTQCELCPNGCLLRPGDRGHCRNRVNRDGTLYTLAYGNPCGNIGVDPVEKKPLFHFLPGTRTLSFGTAGCVFRCQNCQNWTMSQRKPEETKSADGPEFHLRPPLPDALSPADIDRLSFMPDDVVETAKALNCPSVSYTYSEPIAFYEYAFDTSKLARQHGLRNIMVTCGSINEKPLRELAEHLDGAHVDLKGFDEKTYRELNTGRLGPILDTLKTLAKTAVWFEVINLVVPTWTDNIETIKRMCGWLADNLGPDRPLHFSKFTPMHKLTTLWPTPAEKLLEARQVAFDAGLRYVYVGNLFGQPGVEDTLCPNCHKPVITRTGYSTTLVNFAAGRCKSCNTAIAGVWR